MRKLLGLLLLIIFQPFVAIAQPIQYSAEVRAIVYCDHGRAVSGFVRSTSDSSITIMDDSLIRIERSSIDSVTFLPRPKEHPGALIGMYAAAIVFGNLSFGGTGQPYGYIQNQQLGSGNILLYLIGIGAGGLLGHGVDLGDNDNSDRTVDLTNELRNNRWERVQYMADAPNRRLSLHFGFYTGAIFPRSEYILQDYAKSNGLQQAKTNRYFFEGANFYSSLDSVYEDFNMLRRAEVLIDVWHTPLTYEMSLQTGLSLVQLGEPAIGWYHDSLSISRSFLVQGTYGTGYFAEAAFSYHLGSLNQGFDFSAGAGIGFADMLVDRGYYTSYSYNSGPSLGHSTTYHADWKSVAELAFFQARANLSRSFSLGLYADAVFAPAKHAEPLPELNIPSYDLHFGNASAGLSVGFNF